MLGRCVSRWFSRKSSVFSSVHAIPRADEAELFPLRERQESLLLENLDRGISSVDSLVDMTGIEANKILMMKTKLGEFTGRALVLAGPDTLLKSPLPHDVVCRPMDLKDTEVFVEQCERLVNFTDDIRRLAQEAKIDGFNRIITVSGLPKGYSRADVATVISEATKGSVSVENLRDVVFRFKKNGYQSDTCFVLLRTADDALQAIKAIQEYPVAQKRVYGTSFGCSFISADRSSLFVSDENLDYLVDDCKYWIMTLGWNGDLDESQMGDVLNKLAIFPNRIVKLGIDGGFLMRFDRMKNTKLVFTRLNRLKRRWRIPSHVSFFAYPVKADIHYAGDEKHEDEMSDSDSDLDEPVMY
jgi:hypothetical protein